MPKINLNKEQTEVFKWWLKFYSLWREIYFNPEARGITIHLDEHKVITKAQINLFPSQSELPKKP